MKNLKKIQKKYGLNQFCWKLKLKIQKLQRIYR